MQVKMSRLRQSSSVPDDTHYIIEFVTLGNATKVSAIDPVTLKEVSLMGAPTTSKEQLTRLAVQKLEYMLEKQKKR